MPGAAPPTPIPESYWVVPGRLLVGAYPGSTSRAEAMARLRSLLAAGVTCFLDLTEAAEMPSYERLLPFDTPTGRRVEYLREPIRDHDVPASRAVMSRILGLLDQALAAGHVVYLHCRGGVGRSAMAAGCWLAAKQGGGEPALEALQGFWQASQLSTIWPSVPETDEQVHYVLGWIEAGTHGGGLEDRARGALLGLAIGESMGLAAAAEAPGIEPAWGQQTSLALCLAESLLTRQKFDARDQIERYLRWRREGYLSATGQPGQPTADVAHALANYEWRKLPMAGSHDPRDRSTGSLARVVAPVLFEYHAAARAVALAGECSRTTHQSPVVLDCCRYYGAVLLGALAGVDRHKVLADFYEPAPGLWSQRPLRDELHRVFDRTTSRVPRPSTSGAATGVLAVLVSAMDAVQTSSDFEGAVSTAIATGGEPVVQAALAGSLAGAFHGVAAIPAGRLERVAQREVLEGFATRLLRRRRGADSSGDRPKADSA